MAESNPSERAPKDPVRIVYHAGERKFARLFNERSLDEVKDVVRRKLGLGSHTDVSLKQMGHGALLDLEDDDDFQAFRVLLRSSVSVDIQVTVSRSQGSPVRAPAARVSPSVASLDDILGRHSSPEPGGHTSVSKPTKTTLPASPSKKPARVATSGQPSAQPEVVRTETSATPAKTLKPPPKRKRTVSFDDTSVVVSARPTEQHALAKPAATPAVSARTAESSTASKPAGIEEPLKKKSKESTKTKTKTTDTQTTEAVESPVAKASAPKTRPKKSGSKAETSAPKVAETSEPPAKKRRKLKKDDSTRAKKSSASGNQDDTDQPSNPAKKASQPGGVGSSIVSAVEKPTGSGVEADTSTIHKSEIIRPAKGMVCASIPQTSESARVRIEVAAAILSHIMSKPSEAIPPEPPAKRKSVKRDTTKSSSSSSALPAEPATMLDDPAKEIPNEPTGHRLEQVILTNEPSQQTPDLNGPSCPICLEAPFHIRYCCPTVLKGPDAICERLEELKSTKKGDQQSLIKQLEGLLRDPKVTSETLLDASPTNGVQSRNVSPAPNASVPRTPNIPRNSHLSEVTVESKDEGSSSESSDDTSEEEVGHQDLSGFQKQKTPDWQPLPSNGDLEAIVRGPASKKQSILRLLDRIVGDEEEQDSDSEEDKAELEEDPDEEPGRLRRLSSRPVTRSSDSESEEEESRSPSRSAEGTSNNLEPSVQGPKKLVEEYTEQGDVVMEDSVDPPVLDGEDNDSSEETHVGSEDRMVLDESTGEKKAKDAAIVVEDEPSSHVPRAAALRLSDALGVEPQESAKTVLDPPSDRDGSVPAPSEVLEEFAADPIEPADDLAPPPVSRSSNADPIEAPPESIFASVPSSIPKPGVSKRIKTRNGQIPDDEADRPVLLEELALEVTDAVTLIPSKGKSRKKASETPASQEPATTRRSARLSSVPPSTSTSAAVVLLNRRSKSGARTSKVAKTPAKQSEERSDASKSSSKDDATRNAARIAATPPMVRWETLAEPSSPSVQLDDPVMLLDELVSSSPHPEDNPIYGRLNNKEKKGRPRKAASSSQADNSQGKERLFDLSSSQIPFPYSQHQTPAAAAVVSNGKQGSEESTDSEDEPKVVKKKTKTPIRYRPLSQLASQASLFSPSLPTPTNKSVTNGKAKKRVIEEDSSSSSSDADEANGSEHIPRGRRAGSALETKKKRKSLLSRI